MKNENEQKPLIVGDFRSKEINSLSETLFFKIQSECLEPTCRCGDAAEKHSFVLLGGNMNVAPFYTNYGNNKHISIKCTQSPYTHALMEQSLGIYNIIRNIKFYDLSLEQELLLPEFTLSNKNARGVFFGIKPFFKNEHLEYKKQRIDKNGYYYDIPCDIEIDGNFMFEWEILQNSFFTIGLIVDKKNNKPINESGN